MATNKICDVCGDPTRPVFVAQVSINILGAVPGTEATGCVHEIESCEACWPKALADMAANVSSQLLTDIPVHREVYVKNDQISEKMIDLKVAVESRDAIKPGAQGYDAAAAAVANLSGEIEALEAQRAALLQSVS